MILVWQSMSFLQQKAPALIKQINGLVLAYLSDDSYNPERDTLKPTLFRLSDGLRGNLLVAQQL